MLNALNDPLKNLLVAVVVYAKPMGTSVLSFHENTKSLVPMTISSGLLNVAPMI